MSEPPPPAKAPRSRLLAVGNVVISQLNTGLIMACSFVVTPAVLYGLGDAAYGGWLLMNSFIGYMRFLDLGMSMGTVKYGAGALERGDRQDLAKLINTSAAMFLLAASLTVIVVGAMAAVLPRIYPNVIPNASETILILGGAMALDLAFRPFAAALRMRSLYLVYDGLEIVTFAIFKLGLLLYFAYQKRLDYHVLALLTFGETAARLLLTAISAFVFNPATRHINPFRLDRSMIRKLATMGVAASIIQIADLVRFQIDAGVIGYFLPENPEGIAIFGVGTRLPSISFTVIGVIGAILMPRFSGLAETEDKKGTDTLLKNANLATGLACALVLVNIAVLGPGFLKLWLGKPWIDQSGRILLIMIPGYFLASLSQPSASMIVGRGKLRSLTILNVTEALVNLVLSIALSRPFGLYGVAIGTSLPLVFFRGILWPMLLQREVGISPATYYRQHATGIALSAIYAVLIGGFSYITFTTYRGFFLVCAASVTIFIVLAIAIVPEAREVARRRLARRRA